MLRRSVLALTLGALLSGGCATVPDQSTPTTPVMTGPSDEVRQLRSTNELMEDRIRTLEGELTASREMSAAHELRRLDAETRLARLQKRFEDLEQAHNDAVSEVVRTQAKLRGSVSQADAASDIAEAEIALSVVELDSSEQTQLRVLLDQASSEFDQGNFGGALYLSNRVKRMITELRNRATGDADFEPIENEIPFESPLALMVRDNSNVRDAPSLNSNVITTLKRGTPVDGYSYSGTWVRVRMADGRDGWIYQTLVTARGELNGASAIE